MYVLSTHWVPMNKYMVFPTPQPVPQTSSSTPPVSTPPSVLFQVRVISGGGTPLLMSWFCCVGCLFTHCSPSTYHLSSSCKKDWPSLHVTSGGEMDVPGFSSLWLINCVVSFRCNAREFRTQVFVIKLTVQWLPILWCKKLGMMVPS